MNPGRDGRKNRVSLGIVDRFINRLDTSQSTSPNFLGERSYQNCKSLLLPYLALSQTSDREAALRRVVQEIKRVEDQRQQNNLITATGILASLILEKDIISRVLWREQMKDSVIYQEILQEGLEGGRQRGREEERRSVATKLLQQGIDIETIALVTELSIADIQRLQANHS